jgi:ribosomal protein L32
MAPLPKRRHSTRRGGKRTASIKLKLPTLISTDGGILRQPHRAHIENGYYVYNGKKIAKA